MRPVLFPRPRAHTFGTFVAALVVTTAVLAARGQPADACDRCNVHFMDSLFSERADTLLARDALATMRNQRQHPFHTQTNAPLVERVEGLPDEAFVRHPGAGPTAPSSTPSSSTASETPPRTASTLAPGERTGSSALVAPAIAPRSAMLREFANSPLAGPRRPADEGAVDAVFEGLRFLDVIRRDEALPVRPTSTVSQDATPDKEFDVVLHEGSVYLGQGVLYEGFLINGSIPGPTLIVDEGDIVRMNIRNDGTVPHGASIHAAYTQTSAYVGKVDPGETESVTFRAMHPGVYMYHCAPGGHAIPMHVLAGQYGMIVVRPTTETYELERQLGRGPDVEIFLLQHEFYGTGYDAIRSSPMYTAFNGRTFRYIEEPIVANPGDYVRIHYLNVGPNLVTTFHIVGIIWDYVYWQGMPANRMTGGQTVTSGPSDAWVIEFRAPPDEGAYLMLNHSVGPTTRGAIGILSVAADQERTPLVLAQGEARTPEEMAALRNNARRIVSPFGIGTPDVDVPVRYHGTENEVVVRILGNSYHPKVIEIDPGTTVRWINEDVFSYMQGEFAGVHNAIGIRGPASFATGLLAHAESATVELTEPGEYDYMCTPHPYMRGRIIVRQPPAPVEEPKGGCTAAGSPSGGPSAALVALLVLGLVRTRRTRSSAVSC